MARISDGPWSHKKKSTAQLHAKLLREQRQGEVSVKKLKDGYGVYLYNAKRYPKGR